MNHQATTEVAAASIGYPCQGQDAFQTFQHALGLYRKSKERVRELEKAVIALSAPDRADPDYNFGPKFLICVRHEQQEVHTEIPVSPEFLRPLIEAALVNERASFDRMARKLNLARDTLQAS